MTIPGTKWDSVFIPNLNSSVRRIGFGCEALGGFNWGHVDISEVQEAISQAIDGVAPGQAVLFDTSDTYGPKLSEERLGETLVGRAERAVIATKFGVRLRDGSVWYDTSVSYADQALDCSLERLQLDTIDLYQLHWPDGKTHLADTLSALEQFRSEGRIKAYGVCNIPPAELLPLVPDFPGLTSFSQSYSLIDRKDADQIRTLCAAGLVFLAYGCLAQGLLSGKYNRDSHFKNNDRRSMGRYKNFHGDRLARNLDVVSCLRCWAGTLGLPITTLALQFVLADLPQAIALAGIKSADQWSQNAHALRTSLSQDVYLNLLECSNETLS